MLCLHAKKIIIIYNNNNNNNNNNYNNNHIKIYNAQISNYVTIIKCAIKITN